MKKLKDQINAYHESRKNIKKIIMLILDVILQQKKI